MLKVLNIDLDFYLKVMMMKHQMDRLLGYMLQEMGYRIHITSAVYDSFNLLSGNDKHYLPIFVKTWDGHYNENNICLTALKKYYQIIDIEEDKNIDTFVYTNPQTESKYITRPEWFSIEDNSVVRFGDCDYRPSPIKEGIYTLYEVKNMEDEHIDWHWYKHG